MLLLELDAPQKIYNIIILYSTDLYHNITDPYGIIRIKKAKNKSLFLRKSNSDPINSVSITYKNSQGKIGQLKITKIDNGWFTEWENEDGEPIEVYNISILKIIQRIFVNYSIE